MCNFLWCDRLRGWGVARGRISRFPIDLRRRPYNTLALPCECVMLERVILRRLLEHLKAIGLFPSVQSAYRKCHSTETAMTRVLSDILMALDRGDVAALALWPYWTCLLRSTQNEFIWCAPARRRHHIPNGDKSATAQFIRSREPETSACTWTVA